MMNGCDVVVVGATGLVGREMVRVLEERSFPLRRLRLLASRRSAGEQMSYCDESITVRACTPDAFAGGQLVLMAAGEAASREWAPIAAQAGALVVDNSAAFRDVEAVPLVVPEINGAALSERPPRGIVANPNCAAIALVMAVAPLHARWPLRRLVVSTYQAVSGRGQAGLDELGEQVSALLRHKDVIPNVFAERIAFNLLAQIGDLDDDGHSGEEAKLIAETRRILAAPELPVAATCVRVPVFNGHALSVTCDFPPAPAQTPTPAEAAARLAVAPGVRLVRPDEAPTPPGPQQAEGNDMTWIGRLRQVGAGSLGLWCVADNLRKGAAVNAVQIAELLWLQHLAAPAVAAPRAVPLG